MTDAVTRDAVPTDAVPTDPATTAGGDGRDARLQARLAELGRLDDAQLRDRFWDLCEQVVAPLVELARTHTSPSVERSVLLRMGIDSVSCQGVVARVADAGLLGKGAGHVLLRLARRRGTDVREAAAALLADGAVLDGLFEPAAAAQGGAQR